MSCAKHSVVNRVAFPHRYKPVSMNWNNRAETSVPGPGDVGTWIGISLAAKWVFRHFCDAHIPGGNYKMKMKRKGSEKEVLPNGVFESDQHKANRRHVCWKQEVRPRPKNKTKWKIPRLSTKMALKRKSVSCTEWWTTFKIIEEIFL